MRYNHTYICENWSTPVVGLRPGAYHIQGDEFVSNNDLDQAEARWGVWGMTKCKLIKNGVYAFPNSPGSFLPFFMVPETHPMYNIGMLEMLREDQEYFGDSYRKARQHLLKLAKATLV